MSRSREIAKFVKSLSSNDIPVEVRSKVKQEILDTLGICLASSSFPFSDKFFRSVQSADSTSECSVIGKETQLSMMNAALLNGIFAHGLDFDDTHMASIIHVSASLMSAGLAVAEKIGASGQELVTALVAGYEITTRIGLAAAGEFHRRGFHPTSLCGVFGTTIVAGKLFDLSEEQLLHALGIAGSMAGGIQQFLQDGSEVKRVHAGWAALSGIYAAQLARYGVTGPERVFEGEFGLYNTHLGPEVAKEEYLTDGLGARWETLAISIKPYPCCHLVHAYMDAALDLKKKHHLAIEDIASIECRIPTTVTRLVCEPASVKMRPPTTYAALFSLPFCVSLLLVKERAGLDEFSEEGIADEAVLSLAHRVSYGLDEEWTLFPRHFSGWVILHTREGQRYESKQWYNRGSPENPLGEEEITAKFMANATRRLKEKDAWQIIESVQHLENEKNLVELFRLLRCG